MTTRTSNTYSMCACAGAQALALLRPETSAARPPMSVIVSQRACPGGARSAAPSDPKIAAAAGPPMPPRVGSIVQHEPPPPVQARPAAWAQPPPLLAAGRAGRASTGRGRGRGRAISRRHAQLAQLNQLIGCSVTEPADAAHQQPAGQPASEAGGAVDWLALRARVAAAPEAQRVAAWRAVQLAAVQETTAALAAALAAPAPATSCDAVRLRQCTWPSSGGRISQCVRGLRCMAPWSGPEYEAPLT
jgi:hypothetical protein